jgi:predicted Ser/Thr protein kinase
MREVKQVIESLARDIEKKGKSKILSFEEYLKMVREQPERFLRNIFQLFSDMVESYVGEGIEEYPDDPESIGFVRYDCEKLLVEGMDKPFFADRLFANRFVRLVRQMRIAATQQNNVYVFVGPHGCGKSLFLNNLLAAFMRYTELPDGGVFETLWRIDIHLLRKNNDSFCQNLVPGREILEIPCPSHDNPFLLIPKQQRRVILEILLPDSKIKEKILTSKEYEWLFKDSCCSICRSIFYALLDKLGKFEKVQRNIFARSYKFDRTLGEGVSVFSPGDIPPRQAYLTDKDLQEEINRIFGSSTAVKYLFSRYAKTNNGIYALMDIKEYNQERFEELRGIVSEGFHKLDESIEEGVRSLFLIVCNPQDVVMRGDSEKHNNKAGKHGKDKKIRGGSMVIDRAFKDRLVDVNVPYVTEVAIEVKIYESVFGKKTREQFLPDVLENFARIIISSRLIKESNALKEWLGEDFGERYEKYCDKDGLLLKMSIYSGIKPTWLSEEDLRSFTKGHRKHLILKEGEKEGTFGISGRDSIRLFAEFCSIYASGSRKKKLITMADVDRFFRDQFKKQPALKDIIPKGFLDSLRGWYNYTVVQQIKESLYDYNERQIREDVLHYIVGVNLNVGGETTCIYTGKRVKATEEFLRTIEDNIWGSDAFEEEEARMLHRRRIVEKYARFIAAGDYNLKIEATELYREIYNTYIYRLKNKTMDPFLKNKSFREAIKAFAKDEFETFDERVKKTVVLLMKNLCPKYGYTELGAREICMYVLDNKIAEEFLDKLSPN